jgi:hypothetical protein
MFYRVKGRGVEKTGIPVGEIRKAWKSACKEAGVSGKLFHDLRRRRQPTCAAPVSLRPSRCISPDTGPLQCFDATTSLMIVT